MGLYGFVIKNRKMMNDEIIYIYIYIYIIYAENNTFSNIYITRVCGLDTRNPHRNKFIGNGISPIRLHSYSYAIADTDYVLHKEIIKIERTAEKKCNSIRQ
jgi:hypothetical protein